MTPLIANLGQIMFFEKIQNKMPALKVMKAGIQQKNIWETTTKNLGKRLQMSMNETRPR